VRAPFLDRREVPMRTTRPLAALLVTILLVAVAACGGDDDAGSSATETTSAGGASAGAAGSDFPVTIESEGGTWTLESPPERIVSLSPTATEILFAIGAGPQVVAVDALSSYPAEAPVT